MPTRDLTFAIVGSGGDGVITVGDMIAQTGAFEGLQILRMFSTTPQKREKGCGSGCAQGEPAKRSKALRNPTADPLKPSAGV